MFEICVIISGGGRGCFSRTYIYCIDYCNIVDSSANFVVQQRPPKARPYLLDS
jgi:hypothetical protein